MTDLDAQAHLNSITERADSEIDLAASALYLSESCSGASREKYFAQIKKIRQEVAGRYCAILQNGGKEDARTRLAALKHVLSDVYDFRLDKPESEPLEIADLARVLERRRGLSIAISILYIDAAREQGWAVDAISFPNYTLCRLEYGGERLIFDAPRQCRLMEAPDLREMVKKALGPRAELSASYFETLSNRETLIQLQNQIKLRLIEMGDYEKALATVEKMRLIDPAEYRLFLDAGVLYAKVHKLQPAMRALESYIQKAPMGRDRQEAQQLLQELRDGLLV